MSKKIVNMKKRKHALKSLQKTTQSTEANTAGVSALDKAKHMHAEKEQEQLQLTQKIAAWLITIIVTTIGLTLALFLGTQIVMLAIYTAMSQLSWFSDDVVLVAMTSLLTAIITVCALKVRPYSAFYKKLTSRKAQVDGGRKEN